MIRVAYRSTLLAAAIIITGVHSTAFAQTEVVSGWTIECDVDRMTDVKVCIAFKPMTGGGRVMVRKAFLSTWLSFGLNDYPGRTGMVRIDSNPAVSYKGTFVLNREQVATLIGQMLAGARGASRVAVFPDGSREHDFSLDGFPDAYARLSELAAVETPKKPDLKRAAD